MNILAVGDIVGAGAREFLFRRLPALKRELFANLCIVNGENAAQGNGVDREAAEDIFTAGADIITTGNHVFQKKDIYEYLDECPFIVRPANYPNGVPGRGVCVSECGRIPIAVINLMGVCFIDPPLLNPFITVDTVLAELPPEIRVIILDFHGEATSEKLAMAHYIDGRASVMFGTHTHVQTADEMIMPEGLGYITDIGMTGPKLSVIGIDPMPVIEKFKTGMPKRFNTSVNKTVLNACLFEVDEKSGKTVGIKRIKAE